MAHASASHRPAARPSAATPLFTASLLAASLTGLLATPGLARSAATPAGDDDLGAYFGFTGPDVVKVGRGAGPIVVADANDDGLLDLIVANNRESRIELHLQRPDASPEDARPAERPNEFPEHWRFRRVVVPVIHEVGAIVVRDLDDDGRSDIVYTGDPPEVVFLRQTTETPGEETFERVRRTRVRGLVRTRSGLAIEQLVGDDAPELVVIADGTIRIHPLVGFRPGPPQVLAAAGDLVAFAIDDLDGDGLNDLVGVVPGDAAPVRVWAGTTDGGEAALGPQTRFEMPSLLDLKTVRIGDGPARLATIERASRRVVVHALEQDVVEAGDREAALLVRGFADPGRRDRAIAIADLDGDGRLDLAAADNAANAIVVHRQAPDRGLLAGESFPGLSDVTQLVPLVAADGGTDLYVLSEDEAIVGRTRLGDGGLPFPAPLALPEGREPQLIAGLRREGHPVLAVLSRQGREHVLDLLQQDEAAGVDVEIELGRLSKTPDHIEVIDADQDGVDDLLLLTSGKPPIGVIGATGEVVEADEMGQSGLVGAASATNLGRLDVDGDGRDELLLADGNFVRALRYVPDPPAGTSPGWQVVRQVNADDPSTEFAAVAVVDGRIVASDRAGDRLVTFERDDDGDWREVDAVLASGLDILRLAAGAFAGDDVPGVLAIAPDAFAVVRDAGSRLVLKELAAVAQTDERIVPHELAAGDVNGDGYTDLVVLDAGEQTCRILTFDDAGRLHEALSWTVFESRLFSGGATREYEPSQAIVADVTGDGADDLVLMVHDRILVLPQDTGGPKVSRGN